MCKVSVRYEQVIMSMFPHIGCRHHQYCAYCHKLLIDNVYCLGENNVRVFVITNIDNQLNAKLKGKVDIFYKSGCL